MQCEIVREERGKNTLSSEIGIPGERAGDKPSLLKKFGSDLVNLY